MGQKSSSLWSRPKVSLTWALRNDIPVIVTNNNNNNINNKNNSRHSNRNRKSYDVEQVQKRNNLSNKYSNVLKKQIEVKRKFMSEAEQGNKHDLSTSRTAPQEGKRFGEERSLSPSSYTSSTRMPRRRRLRRSRPRSSKPVPAFGYEIRDVDEFLTNASLENPGNIPMVLSRPCVLYETHTEGPQKEVNLPLGMVVNGVLKNKAWLYAQTPHGEEGYVPYACCLPLGILPAPSRPQPCWDTQTDIFPTPMGNKTDSEKVTGETKSECGGIYRNTGKRKRIRQDSGEKSVDGLYMRASRRTPKRHTLLVIGTDYRSPGSSSFSVCKGDVVSLISTHLGDWFWVRNRNGKEGLIPASVAGHGFF